MNADLERRLAQIEAQIRPPNHILIVEQQVGESDEDVSAKIERWRRGEHASDLNAQPTQYDELVVVLRVFGPP